MDNGKLDPQKIRRGRDERAWPQEQLAAVTGLSLRTIQRVESDGTASLETRRALAAAFGVEPGQLRPMSATGAEPGPAAMPAQPAAGPAADPAPQLPWMHYRLLRFVVLAGLLVALDVHDTGRLTWSRWALAFGLALFALRLVRWRFVEPGPLDRRRGRSQDPQS